MLPDAPESHVAAAGDQYRATAQPRYQPAPQIGTLEESLNDLDVLVAYQLSQPQGGSQCPIVIGSLKWKGADGTGKLSRAGRVLGFFKGNNAGHVAIWW